MQKPLMIHCDKQRNYSYFHEYESCTFLPLLTIPLPRLSLFTFLLFFQSLIFWCSQFEMFDDKQVNIQQQMMRTHKLSMMKSYSQRLRQRLFYDLLEQEVSQKQQHQIQEPAPNGVEEEQEEEESLEVEEQLQQEQIVDLNGQQQDFSVADYIQMLSPRDRETFKKENPQLPPLFFMTRAQKKKYFEHLNKSFRQEISKTPQRKSKTKKILKFKNEFQVKHFNEQQKVVALSKAKQMRQSYHQKIHFS